MKQKRILAVFLSICLLFCTCTGLLVRAETVETYQVSVTGTAHYDRCWEVLDLINELRVSEGLNELTLDDELMDAAMIRAAESSVDFTHYRPDGSSCFTVCSKVTGENLAAGYDTAEATFAQWKNSPGHYANMIRGNYKSIGISCFEVNGVCYWAQLFSPQEGTETDKAGDTSFSTPVTVAAGEDDVVDFNMDDGDFTLSMGEACQLNVCRQNPSWDTEIGIYDADSFTWETSDPDLATVDENGVVHPKKEGQVTITATVKKGTLVCSRTFTVVNDAVTRVMSTYDIVRIYGQTRYGTSMNIAQQLRSAYGVEQFDSVILAYSKNFPDALSGAYLATVKHAPILLVDSVSGGDSSEKLIRDYVRCYMKTGGTIYVLGGKASVSPSYADDIAEHVSGKTVYLSGTDRFDTNLKILQEAGLTDQDEILIADASTNNSFADALSASSTGRPILLVNQSGLTTSQVNYLTSSGIKKVTILGGENVVPASTEQKLKQLGFTVTRLAGETRYETSVKIASHYFDTISVVTLAWGGAFPDALCGGPLANALGSPVLLTTESNSLAGDYGSKLRNFKLVALGGAGQSNNQLTDKAINNVKQGVIVKYSLNY